MIFVLADSEPAHSNCCGLLPKEVGCPFIEYETDSFIHPLVVFVPSVFFPREKFVTFSSVASVVLPAPLRQAVFGAAVWCDTSVCTYVTLRVFVILRKWLLDFRYELVYCTCVYSRVVTASASWESRIISCCPDNAGPVRSFLCSWPFQRCTP